MIASISRYRILEKIADGGMGVGYRAEDTKLHRSVAMKLLPQEPSQAPLALERFYREARATSGTDVSRISARGLLARTREVRS
jgi:serine/threonine protein kinase